MRTKIFTSLFAIVAFVGTMSAVETVEIGILNYQLDESTQTAVVIAKWDVDYNNYPDIQGALTIPSTVTYENVTYTVASIAKDAFTECKTMTSVTIPGSVATVGQWSFAQCEGLTSVIMEDGVQTIEVCAFWSCENLVSASIPNTVTSIEAKAFYHCRSLTTVNIPTSITAIPKEMFNGCTNLSTLSIPSNITSIGEYAFGGCGFVSMTVPSTITVIDKAVFWKCANLVEVTIPASVTEIKNIAFKGCSSLARIYNQRTTPANAYSDVFDGVDKFNCTLYVPEASIDMYSNAAVWRDFYNIEAIEDAMAIDEVEVDGSHGQKVIRDGKVLIERGDKTYTLQGAEVQ